MLARFACVMKDGTAMTAVFAPWRAMSGANRDATSHDVYVLRYKKEDATTT